MRLADGEGVVIRQGVHFRLMRRVVREGKRCGQDTESSKNES